jgi:arginase
VVGALSPLVITLAARTSDRSLGGIRGAVALAPLVARRLGIGTHTVGSASLPREVGWSDDLRDSRGPLLEAGGQLEDAFGRSQSPVLLAGDCSVALSTLPTLARVRPEARVLWIDAHGDFNTPESTSSGYLGGMCLAGACGIWDTGLGDAFPPERVVVAGAREFDPGEEQRMREAGMTVVGPWLREAATVDEALGNDPVFVHVDLDALDPPVMPARFPASGGFDPDDLRELLATVAGGRDVVGFEVTGFEAPVDELKRMLYAETAVRVLEPLIDGLKRGAHVGN